MAQIALAWQFEKGVAAPIIGATKATYFDDAAGSFDVKLTKPDYEIWLRKDEMPICKGFQLQEIGISTLQRK